MADAQPLPKYIQISERLIREIAAGHIANGARLPPERDMAADLGIAVGTLRKALGDLEAKGLLERIQGSGNYVRHKPDVDSVYAFFRLERVQGGGLPTAEVLTVDRLAKPEGPHFGPDPEGHRIRRVRRLDDVVIAVEEIWLDGGWRQSITRQDLSDSLYLYYRETLGLVIASVEDRIGVAPVPEHRLVTSNGLGGRARATPKNIHAHGLILIRRDTSRAWEKVENVRKRQVWIDRLWHDGPRTYPEYQPSAAWHSVGRL